MKIQKVILLSFVLICLLPGSGSSAVTLEILDLSFPKNCGASLNEDLNTCTRCHPFRQDQAANEAAQKRNKILPQPHKTITSLEKIGRITVSVPTLPLKPDQPFTQEFTFNGHQIMYEYGYCKDGGPLNILQLRWILDSPKHDFLEEHDGHSLPLLHEPGDYIFVLKLLHDSNNDPVKGSRLKEVVLLWTLSVSDGGLQKYN